MPTLLKGFQVLVWVCPTCLCAFYGRQITDREVMHFSNQELYGYDKYSVVRINDGVKEDVTVTVRQVCNTCDQA